jgi:hypothetical protein
MNSTPDYHRKSDLATVLWHFTLDFSLDTYPLPGQVATLKVVVSVFTGGIHRWHSPVVATRGGNWWESVGVAEAN